MKKENDTTSLKKLGYGLKYTLVVALAILAICALSFIFINVTTYFAPPLQPMFDQERLGQLGDFLGGTLNPFFGFITILLLFTSLIYQIKANKQQVNIFETEVKIRQIDDAIQKSIAIINRNLLEEFPIPIEYKSQYGSIACDGNGNPIGWITYKLKSIKDVVDLYNNKYDPQSRENYPHASREINSLLNDPKIEARTGRMLNKEFLVRMVKQLEILIESMMALSSDSESNFNLRLISIEVKEIVKKFEVSGLLSQTRCQDILKILDSF